MAAQPHTLHCALVPATCRHSMRDITTCVICQKPLECAYCRTPGRPHVDTCSERCFKKLCRLQRGGE